MTGAEALVEALVLEGVGCVYGIPGRRRTNSGTRSRTRACRTCSSRTSSRAACMADGYARSTGRPGVLCVVPGPGVTNSLTGLGEALLDSSPVVAIVGDVGNGEKARPFQVHCLNQVELLQAGVQVRLPGADGRADSRRPCGRRSSRRRAANPARSRSWCRTTCSSRRTTSACPPPAVPDSAVRRCRVRAGAAVPARPEGAHRHLRRRRVHGLSATNSPRSRSCCKRRSRPAFPARA